MKRLLALLAFAVCLSACLTPREAGEGFFDSASAPEDANGISALPDPSQPGPYTVASFRYASPYNPRRPEYAPESVQATSPTFDITPYWDDVQRSHWGYGSDAVPLNGEVYYPADGNWPYPLVVCVHGNHDPYEASEFGYEYLGRHLASRGYIFASIDENFLNGNSNGEENDARAILLLEHAKLLRGWNADPANPLYGLVDMDRVVVIGHSRGGEAAYTATVFNSLELYPDNGAVRFDYGLPVIAAVCLAPVEGQYRPQNRLVAGPAGTDYLVLHGGMDGDVEDNMGEIYARRGEPAAGSFRSSLWIYGANHAQFNTTWSRQQDPSPTLRHLLISAEDQRRIALVAVTAFLETVTGRERAFEEFFRSPRAFSAWLPSTRYVALYRNGLQRVLADFEEDALLTSASRTGWSATASGFRVWTEDRLDQVPAYFFMPIVSGVPMLGDVFTKQDHILSLAWGPDPDEEVNAEDDPAGPQTESEPVPVYALASADNPVAASILSFELGAVRLPEGATTMDFTVEILTNSGAVCRSPLSRFFALETLPRTWVFPFSATKQALETVTIPLDRLPGFAAGDAVTGVRLVFDLCPEGEILVDRIALE